MVVVVVVVEVVVRVTKPIFMVTIVYRPLFNVAIIS